jgi:hypothetical protein
MRWVEAGEAPGGFVGKHNDYMTGTTTRERPIYAYPAVTRYKGTGDPTNISSYEAVELPA